MARRSPVRFLAPLALLAVAVAFYMVVSSGLGGQADGGSTSTARPTATAKPASKSSKSRKRRRRAYVVKPGDTPSQIAEKTGVTLEQLEQANPDLDPQLLAPGERIKLPR